MSFGEHMARIDRELEALGISEERISRLLEDAGERHALSEIDSTLDALRPSGGWSRRPPAVEPPSPANSQAETRIIEEMDTSWKATTDELLAVREGAESHRADQSSEETFLGTSEAASRLPYSDPSHDMALDEARCAAAMNLATEPPTVESSESGAPHVAQAASEPGLDSDQLFGSLIPGAMKGAGDTDGTQDWALDGEPDGQEVFDVDLDEIDVALLDLSEVEEDTSAPHGQRRDLDLTEKSEVQSEPGGKEGEQENFSMTKGMFKKLFG